MGNRCLTIYDITGIQEFIFSSSKAKENIGASIYVQELFEKALVDELKKVGNVVTDWQNASTFKTAEDSSISAEIVYIGGGNAMVLFDRRENAVATTKRLAKKLLDDTQATLGLATASLETGLEDFNRDRKELQKRLNLSKNSFLLTTPLRGISITRECEDGLPSNGEKSEKNRKIYISRAAGKKRRQAGNKNIFADLLQDCSDYDFPLDFDKLGRCEGESHIAVVHIDGNSMGRFIDGRLNGITEYGRAVAEIREISTGIREHYHSIFRKMLDFCRRHLKKPAVSKRIVPAVDENGRQLLPVRPIILNGDDVTFVSDGRIGIQLANCFLQQLATTPLRLGDERINLSACAGIAIVKSHFPFYRAYDLAEALCGSAKKKAKEINREDPGCWLDYHIVYAGFHSHLDQMRAAQYNIPGMNPVEGDYKFRQYNLLLRPFGVAGTDPERRDNWHKTEQLYMEFNSRKKWPRSRLKNLRNSFIVSREEVEALQKENSSRRYQLPEFRVTGTTFDDGQIFHRNQTPYFEPLELLDFYIPEFSSENQED